MHDFFDYAFIETSLGLKLSHVSQLLLAQVVAVGASYIQQDSWHSRCPEGIFPLEEKVVAAHSKIGTHPLLAESLQGFIQVFEVTDGDHLEPPLVR